MEDKAADEVEGKEAAATKEEEAQAMITTDKKINEVKNTVKFDEILADLGDFGRYQKLSYFLLFLPTIFSAMQKQSW